MSEEEFEPRLGRIGKRGVRKARKYLGRIVAAAARAGPTTGVRSRRFDGSRIGRGAGVGRLLSSRDRHAGLRSRRAIVKTRLVRLAGKGLSGATAHLRYIRRDGVTREGAPGELYSADLDHADGKDFLDRSAGDRHQFRFIVSAEDGADYPDLKPLIRRLMVQAGEDLGTRLDWVAVDHFNTGHPHTHIMLRGVDEHGANLVIARDYIAHGLRERAAELVNRDLGPRTDLEIEAKLRHDIGAERLTAIDRRLVRDQDADRMVTAADRDPFQQSLRAGRLQTLGTMGLAEDMGGGRWRLDEGLEETLRRVGERGDIIRTMQRELSARKLDRPGVEQRVFTADDGGDPVVGRIIARGLADEHRDRHFLLVDGVDGRSHYVDIGRGDAVDTPAPGAIVRVTPRTTGIREVDRTIDAVARANGGFYSADLHRRHDPNASRDFAEAHVRRLEALRRGGDVATRGVDGRWAIAEDHLDRVAAHEARLNRDRPVMVETLSTLPLDRMGRADAPTWLDRMLVGEEASPARDIGFGRDVREAAKVRRQWLIEQGLASEQSGDLPSGLLAALRRRELLRAAAALDEELGKDFVETTGGDRIEGLLARRVDLASGRYALIERSREFSLVPWNAVLERQVGKPVGGIVRDVGGQPVVNWTIGRQRGGPSIS